MTASALKGQRKKPVRVNAMITNPDEHVPARYRVWLWTWRTSEKICAERTREMVEAFPELRRVRGHYISPLDGNSAHWWCETPDGLILDPTLAQFQDANGEYREYTGAEPIGKCYNCGELYYYESGYSAVCSRECAQEALSDFASTERVL